MTTLISNGSAPALQGAHEQTAAAAAETAAAPPPPPAEEEETPAAIQTLASRPQTLASRFIMLTLCIAIVLSTLAYGTVHTWSLAVFQMGAAVTIFFWAVDAWRSKLLRFGRSALQLPLLGLLAVGLVQLLLPLGDAGGLGAGGDGVASISPISLDPYSTRLTLVQLFSLFVYFAAALAFTDSPHRLRLLVRTITIFGFVLALFGLIQSFTSPTKIYWFREDLQSTPFGPFINRHHFAGYMELTLALPLGLLFSGAVASERRVLYAFAAALMGLGLIMTNSRGGILSLIAQIFFLVVITGMVRRRRRGTAAGADDAASATTTTTTTTTTAQTDWRGVATRAGLGVALLFAIVFGVLFFGGEDVLSRLVGTVNAEDPTTGRTHFWSVTLDVIREHPLIGVGLGAYSLAYTRYDTRSGLFRVEQAHNDYLQILADTGIVGAALGLFFVVWLFRVGLARCREPRDKFRRGVAVGALTGCFGVLIHSFFDFTLHTTSNALLFLVLAVLATAGSQVEQLNSSSRRKGRRRGSQRATTSVQATASPLPENKEAAAATAATAGRQR